jgi:hypothetical protein
VHDRTTKVRLAYFANRQSSQVLRNSPELGEHRAAGPAAFPGTRQAMVDMIVNQGLFRVIYRVLDGLELLRQFDAGLVLFDHFNNHSQMTVGTLETLGDI